MLSFCSIAKSQQLKGQKTTLDDFTVVSSALNIIFCGLLKTAAATPLDNIQTTISHLQKLFASSLKTLAVTLLSACVGLSTCASTNPQTPSRSFKAYMSASPRAPSCSFEAPMCVFSSLRPTPMSSTPPGAPVADCLDGSNCLPGVCDPRLSCNLGMSPFSLS